MKLQKSYQFLLFFCTLTFINTNTEYTHATPTACLHVKNEVSPHRSHQHFTHHDTYKSHGFDRSSPNRNHFKQYTAQDFQNHFTARHYTENKILHQRCLYIFDEFVKFAQTYSSYTCTIQQLHAELKNITFAQKNYHTIKGTYCPGLQKRINYLYYQLNSLKPIVTTNKQPIVPVRYVSTDTLHTQIPEYKELQSVYKTYASSLSGAIEKRLKAYNYITTTDYALRYKNQSYILNNNIKQLLSKYNHDTASFTECFGNELHQTIHQESLDLLDRIDHLSPNSLLYDHQEALVDFTVAIANYNHEGMTHKATQIADFCWTLLDYGQAVIEGAALGVYSAAADIVNNPIEATVNIVAGKQVLMYQLSKVLYNVADIGVTAISDYDQAKNKWDKYTQPLNNIIDAINKKEITLRDAIKNGTALFVGYKTQGKLLGGLGKFCNTIKQKSISFLQNNLSVDPQVYFSTPEGLLFKATAQSDKLKQSSQPANNLNTLKKLTSKELTDIADKLKFKKTNYYSHGQPVFKKGSLYITPDVDGHNGGIWKMADSIENLRSKKTRLGTYDINLNRIGD